MSNRGTRFRLLPALGAAIAFPIRHLFSILRLIWFPIVLGIVLYVVTFSQLPNPIGFSRLDLIVILMMFVLLSIIWMGLVRIRYRMSTGEGLYYFQFKWSEARHLSYFMLVLMGGAALIYLPFAAEGSGFGLAFAPRLGRRSLASGEIETSSLRTAGAWGERRNCAPH